MGGGGQRGTGRGGPPPGSYGRVAERYPLEGDKVRKGVNRTIENVGEFGVEQRRKPKLWCVDLEPVDV